MGVDDSTVRMNPEASFSAGRFHQAVFDTAIFASIAVECFHLYVQTPLILFSNFSLELISFFFYISFSEFLLFSFFSSSKLQRKRKSIERRSSSQPSRNKYRVIGPSFLLFLFLFNSPLHTAKECVYTKKKTIGAK